MLFPKRCLRAIFYGMATTLLTPGIVAQKSRHSVDETVRKLEEALRARNINLFALIDHSGEAEKVGLQMPNTKLVIFGAPQAGTPIMVAAPSSAIDLPLKVLIFEDVEGSVWLYHNSPSYLRSRHGFSEELEKNIAGVQNLIDIVSA